MNQKAAVEANPLSLLSIDIGIVMLCREEKALLLRPSRLFFGRAVIE